VFGKFDFAVYDEVMNVNVEGPLRVAQAFIDNVAASEQKKIINISSTQGSIAETVPGRGNSYFYKSSKSALNMVTHILSLELKDRGITVGLVSPGWVDTHFGNLPSLPGMIQPEESAAGVVSVIDDFGIEKTGTFITHEGKPAPW
jgi:NAD(P)-dependent dehydrogenase (short-subunit alcohol dehydrogenase family)